MVFNPFDWPNVFGTKDSQPGESNNFSSKVESKEKVTVLSSQTNLQFDGDQVKSVLSDFENNPCNDAWDVMNYNEGKEANPFDKIAKYYGRKKNVFLFIDVVFHKEKEIMDIISKKCDAQAREKFRERMKIYSDRIGQGINDAKEFLNSDLTAFFNGYHVACPGHDRNIHENLNINITKPGQTFETSRLFTEKIKRMEEEKSEVKRAKIYDQGKKILTIEKNEKQQRNYSFTKLAICDIEMSWNAKDTSEKDLSCAIVLSINSGQVSIKKSTINGQNIEPNNILELAKQNEVALIEGKALHEVLGKCLAQQTQPEEKEYIATREYRLPESALNGVETTKVAPSPQKQNTIH